MEFSNPLYMRHVKYNTYPMNSYEIFSCNIFNGSDEIFIFCQG